MNTADIIAGAIIGGIIWALLAYIAIGLLFTIEDNATDKARHRARRSFGRPSDESEG